jgi:sugar phosphate isomerase/epimerase
MRICLSEALVMPASFADDVEACAAAGCDALEVWLTKLETHLESHSLDGTRDLLAKHRVSPAAAAYQGGLLLSQGEARKAHYEHFRRRLELCQSLEIGTLLVAADFTAQLEPADLDRAVVSLTQAGQWAAGFGVRLALEFRGSAKFCSNIETALRLIQSCGQPNVGLNLDIFHYWTGPSKEADLDLLTADNLAWVQVSDLAGVPRELASDSDRILPGDGDLPLTAVLARLRSRGYDGFVSLELLNQTFWQMKPTQVMEIGMAAMRRLLASE